MKNYPTHRSIAPALVVLSLSAAGCTSGSPAAATASPSPTLSLASVVSEHSPENLTACAAALKILAALEQAKFEPPYGHFIGESGTVATLEYLASSAMARAQGPIDSALTGLEPYTRVAAETNYLTEGQRTSAVESAESVLSACGAAGFTASDIQGG